MKKIYPNRTLICLYLAIVSLVIGGVLFLILKDSFLTNWGPMQYVIIAVYAIFVGLFYFLTLKTTYYVVNNMYISFFRLGKELRYFYKDVIFVDESKGTSTRTIGFYTRQGSVIYLTSDKDLVIYNALLEKSKNRISLEEFKKKYPKIEV